jgi:hypothetical protein
MTVNYTVNPHNMNIIIIAESFAPQLLFKIQHRKLHLKTALYKPHFYKMVTINVTCHILHTVLVIRGSRGLDI